MEQHSHADQAWAVTGSLGRLGTAEEVATMVRFIVCEGTYITGAVFNVNGGMFIG